jgi:hypothetical protein
VPSGVSAQYLWAFGDDIVLTASQIQGLHGRWQAVPDASAAGGTAIENADRAEAKVATALTSPANYIEATFHAAAGVPYRLWIRMRAAGDSYTNDSIYVQFSGSVSQAGSPVTRIGSSDALGVILEDGTAAGVQGWGWADAAYGTLAPPIYFNQDGLQTIRIQQREDGARIDQVVISANAFFDSAPGAGKADTTLVPRFPAAARGTAVGHMYRARGTYPVTLTIDAGSAGAATDSTESAIQ